MADSETTGTQGDHEQQRAGYLEFANQLGYELHRLRYQADAARALLREHEGSESDHELVGTSYMLTDIAELANNLAERLDESSFKYVEAPPKTPSRTTAQTQSNVVDLPTPTHQR